MKLRLLLCCLLVLAGTAAFAQPFNAWLVVNPGYPTNHGYVELPSNAALNFEGKSFTFEAWIATGNTACRSLAGNGYHSSQWIGVCEGKLRSYVRGDGNSYDAGDVRASDWTHIAVTFDNATKTRRHYVDGELVGERVEAGGILPATHQWRIFSDFDYEFTPSGSIDEVRFWNVARTTDQIRSTITSTITAPQTGLVAVYHLDGSANDAIAGLHGTKLGAGGYLNAPIGPAGCTTSASQLCVGPSGRFGITATWQTESSNGYATVASLTTSESGIFWFFAPTNWEVIVKVLNGCGLNNRWWVFTSGLTNQHYELVVTDYKTAITKRYFNYQGVIAPQVQDLDAFATCP